LECGPRYVRFWTDAVRALMQVSRMAGHVLVVDDDGDVRDVILGMLQDSGFVATAATGGAAMRDILAADAIPIDALVLDYLLPGEPSAALAIHAKGLRIPVVMISGSHDSVKFAEDNGLQFVRKPFRMVELIEAVENAVASGQSGA
jgi:two-component system OmpR family response regulator